MWRVLPHQQCQLQDGDDVMQKLQKLQEFSEVKNEYPAHSGQASEGMVTLQHVFIHQICICEIQVDLDCMLRH